MDWYDHTYWVSKVKFVQGSLEQAKSIEKVLTLNWKNIKYTKEKKFLYNFLILQPCEYHITIDNF